MPVYDPQRISDGFITLERGVDNGKSPSLLDRNQASFAVNVTMRGGYAKTRPAFNHIALTFAAKTQSEAEDMRAIFTTGRYQGACAYVRGEVAFIVCSIGGYIFRIDPLTGKVNDITPKNADRTPDRNASNIEVCYFQQAEQYLIIQDGRNRPIIFDGANCRRSNIGQLEVPTGTAMAYGGGRLWVAKGREFVAGDIVGGPTSVIKFSENTYIAEGGSFSVPLDTGDITAMKFMNQPDSSLGQGELLVHTSNAVFAVNVPTDRDAWKNVEYPTVRIVAINYGSISDRSCVLVNSDMFYRSNDGVRSYISSRREWQEYGQIPVSRELSEIFANDALSSVRSFASGVLFDNRMLMTVSPAVGAQGMQHGAIAALDFDLVGGTGAKSHPAWEGLWTGLNFLQLFTADVQYTERCYTFACDPTCGIELWELTKNGTHDRKVVDDLVINTPIACYVETGDFSFQNPFELKRLEYGELFIDSIEGDVAFDIKYKPNQYPAWVNWHAFRECALFGNCNPTDGSCLTFDNHKPQYRTRVRTPQPADVCEQTSGSPMRNGYTLSARIGWTGYARLKGFRMHAYPIVEEPYGGCGDNSDCV